VTEAQEWQMPLPLSRSSKTRKPDACTTLRAAGAPVVLFPNTGGTPHAPFFPFSIPPFNRTRELVG